MAIGIGADSNAASCSLLVRHVGEEIEMAGILVVFPFLRIAISPGILTAVVAYQLVVEDLGSGIARLFAGIVISPYAHLSGMSVRVVFLVLVGTGFSILAFCLLGISLLVFYFLGFYGEGDFIVMVGMLYGHIVAVAGAEACEDGKLAEDIFQFLHIFQFLGFVEELVEACFAEAGFGAQLPAGFTSRWYQFRCCRYWNFCSIAPLPLRRR